MINDILEMQWLSKTEVKTYLATLELWTSQVSRIARKVDEKRSNTYHILQNLENKWLVHSVIKNKVKSYYAIDPKALHEKIQQKADELLANMPELLALAAKWWEKMSVQLYEWYEWFKMAYEHVTLSSEDMWDDECFLTFIWTQCINKTVEKYLVNEFAPRRMKFKTKSKIIIDKKSLKWDEDYAKYNTSSHESLIVDYPNFNLSNEIVIHGKDEVSIMMYGEEDISALIIKSSTLHNALKSIFTLIWETYPRTNKENQ